MKDNIKRIKKIETENGLKLYVCKHWLDHYWTILHRDITNSYDN